MLFIDLRTRLSRVRSEVDRRIAAVLDHGQFILGPEVEELEEKLADYVGVKHCVGVSSGTDALLIALMALEIGPGDEVITVPYTWISTAEVIVLLGAKPVFVDIRPDTWNMDPELLEDAITERTRAIIPVGIYGQPPDMDSINEIAQRHNLTVIEDAAQSFGAIYKGKRSCALSAIGCTSFFPTKPLGGFGDGGAMFTNDDALAEKFRQIRVHGQSRKHHHPLLGVNGRLDTLQAAALLAIFGEFENEIESRQAISNCYDKLLQFVKSVEKINIQKVRPDTSSVYAQYTILSPERDALQNQFWDAGIPTVAYYKIPLHMQPVFRELRYKQGDFSVAEEVSNQCLSLPVCTNMSKSDQQKITKVLAALN